MNTPQETSPYRLMQEEFRDEPWKLLVGCICLNCVSAKVARPVWEKIFRRWPTWVSLLKTPKESAREELVDMLRPLGFQNRRAERILRMTDDLFKQYEGGRDRMTINPLELHGVGKYGADSYNMFVKGLLINDVEDKELKNYVRWARENPGNSEQVVNDAQASSREGP